MKEKKTLRRRWWFTNDQCQLAEKWLTDLAAEGWRLKSVGFYTAVFTKCNPCSIRYCCIDVSPFDCGSNGHIKSVFAAEGWTYIDYKSDVHVFCAPEGTAPPAEFANAMRRTVKQKKQLIKRLIFTTCALAIFAAICYFLYSNDFLFLQFLLQRSVDLIAIILVLLGLAVDIVYTMFRLLSLLWRRGEDLSQRPDENYKKIIRRARSNRITASALAVLLFAAQVGGAAIVTTGPAPKAETLAVLHTVDFVDLLNQAEKQDPLVIRSSGVLYPYQLIELEDSVAADDILDFKAYRALNPWLAGFLADQSARYFADSYQCNMTVPGDAMGFTKLWEYDDAEGSVHLLVALMGKDVYAADFRGSNTAKELAAALRKKLG